MIAKLSGFNTQPPEGGWAHEFRKCAIECDVSTHSRLKAAGVAKIFKSRWVDVFQHTAA